MFCSKCGKELGDDAKFCSSCGAVIRPPGASTQQDMLPPPEPLPPGAPPPSAPTTLLEAPKRRISVGVLTAIIIMTVLVILAAVAVPAVFIYSNSQKTAQRKTCQANQRNVQMAIMTYAATSADESYPTSLQDLVSSGDSVLDRIPTCPSGNKPYIWVKGSVNTPPSISCPNRADHAL